MRSPGQRRNEDHKVYVYNKHGLTRHSQFYAFMQLLVNRNGVAERDGILVAFLKKASQSRHEIGTYRGGLYGNPLEYGINGQPRATGYTADCTYADLCGYRYIERHCPNPRS